MDETMEDRENIIRENIILSKKILQILNANDPAEKVEQSTNKGKNSTEYILAEVNDIIEHSNEELKKKIPQNFMNILISAKDNSYVSELDYEKPLKNQIQHETKIILGIIYRDYLCDENKKQELIKYENELLEKFEQERNKKYSVDNLFQNRPYTTNIQQPNQIQDNEQNKIIEYKEEKWYEKIINFFKSLFGKK